MLVIMKVILSILEIIPILDKWADALVIEFAKQKKERGNERFSAALESAVANKSTVDLRRSMGSNIPD